MTTPLISDSEMAALRGVAEMGMQTSVRILTRTNAQTDDGQESTWTYARTVMGWIYSTPTPTIEQVSGQMATVNTYRLFVPVGTVIDAGDRVVASGATYTVSDTNVESTWKPYLQCSLRLVE